MGKSGGRKKKSGVNQNDQVGSSDNNNNNNSINSSNKANGGVDLESPILLQKAHELKEEGNKRFQAMDYVGAFEQYENALRLVPRMHPYRAVFHSNKAACLMQMKPVNFETVISECSLALQVHPRFVRALIRRARAFEAIGKYDMALQDVQMLLNVEPNQRDALDIAGRLRVVLGTRLETQQDLQSRPSPAALGASAALGAPIAGVGPCLPPRPVSKKQSVAAPTVSSSNNKADKPNPILSDKVHEPIPQLSDLVLKPSNGLKSNDTHNQPPVVKNIASAKQPVEVPIRWRPLKLAYDNDIRLSQMPVKCSFRALRDIVSKRFPMSKFVLIKYKDADGDLVTITCTPELRLAESSVDNLVKLGPDEELTDSLAMLKLYIVEASPEQEPPVPDEEEEEKLQEREDKSPELDDAEGNESVLHSSKVSTVLGTADAEVNIEKVSREKPGVSEDPECEEVEMDDWLFEFAQLFRGNVCIDPDAHIDLHELGLELCSEALEETITSVEAQVLFDKASLKFQEVAALAFFNWGNVHMCAARKRCPINDSGSKESTSVQLQAAYDFVKEKYSLAKQKYEEALQIKADFYEGLLALGQQRFEMAKLHWSFVLAKKDDLSTWDPTETLQLFDIAEELMKRAKVMWEKLEEQRANELKDTNASKKDELLKRRKKDGSESEISSAGGRGEASAVEVEEQAALIRSQMHLFFGNMLFERSQVECKLGMTGWKANLDTAIGRFRLAGASETDISTVMKNHCSNEEAAKGSEKKVENGNIDITDAIGK